MQIVVFTSDVFSHPAIKRNMDDLIDGFRQLGHNVVEADIGHLNTKIFDMLRNGEADLTVGIYNLWLEPLQKNQKAPHITMLLDEPFNRHCSGYDKPVPKHLVTYLDRSDGDMLRYIFSNLKHNKKFEKHTLFMPLGGGCGKDEVDFENRPFDIVFSSGFWPIDDTPDWRKNNSSDACLNNILDDTLYIMQHFPVNVRVAFAEVLRARGMYDEEYIRLMMPHFWKVLSYIKPWRKIQTVKRLAETGRTIHIIGEGYPRGKWSDYVEGDNIITHGTLPYDEMLKVVRKSKILVTDQACFNDGAHDRVFIGMLNGAAVVAEYSSYLDEIFDNQKDIFFYDWNNTDEHLSIVHKLIDDDNFRFSTVKNMYLNASQNHTWKNRAEKILDALYVLYGQNYA